MRYTCVVAKRRAQEHTQAPPRDDWCSPPEVVEPAQWVLNGIDLDPASNPNSIIDARVSIYHVDIMDGSPYVLCDPRYPNAVWGDGRTVDWSWARNAWINPPYGRGVNREWVTKIAGEADKGLEQIALVPASPGAKWFRYYWDANALCFWEGRLQFLGAPANADFESVVAYFGLNRKRFWDAFNKLGHVVAWTRTIDDTRSHDEHSV